MISLYSPVVANKPATVARSPRFEGIREDQEAFSKLPPLMQFKAALDSMSRTTVQSVRKGVLEACIDAWTLESFNAVPYFINSLDNKNLQGCTIVKEFAQKAGKALTMQDLMEMTGDVILERADNDPDPSLKALANQIAPTVRLIRGLNR